MGAALGAAHRLRLPMSAPLLSSPPAALNAASALAEARAARDLGAWAEALVAGQQAWTLATDIPDRVRAGHLISFCLFRQGRLEALIEQGEACLALLKSLAPEARSPLRREEVELLRWVTLAACETGQFDLALKRGQASCDLALHSGQSGDHIVALNALGACFERMGDPWQAERLMREGLEEARQLPEAYPRLVSLNNLAAVTIGAFHLLRGGIDPAEAESALVRSVAASREALALAQKGDVDPFFLVFIEGNLGEALVHQGRLDEAEQWLTSALQRAQTHQHLAQIWRIRSTIAEAQIQRGHPEQARDGLRELLQASSAAVPQATLIRLHLALYLACRQLGLVEEALVHHEAAERLQRQRAALQLRAQSRLLVTRVEAEQTRRQAEFARREAQDAQARAAELALHAQQDALTGLGNRRHFNHALPGLLDQSERTQQPLVLAVMDIDHFKAVNDRFGHRVGDEVLVHLAQLLRLHTRTGDLLARFGGEEFVLVLPNTSQPGAEAVCERLRQHVAEHAWSGIAPGLAVTVSLGLAATPPYGGEGLFDRADRALYEAKQQGRNRLALDGSDGAG